jgi:ABC-type multidrug transport system fused ATPase/permease subunit
MEAKMVQSVADRHRTHPEGLQLPADDGAYNPAADAGDLPEAAKDLASILRGEDVQRLANDYAAADQKASVAQARFNANHRWEVRAATAAAILGALFLSPLGETVSGPSRAMALIAQYAALATAIILGLWVSRIGALDTWREARFAAEDLRTGLFRAILKPTTPAALPWQLAYFEQRLFRAQLEYFTKKTDQHRAALNRTSRWNWLGAGMLGMIFVIGVLSTVTLLQSYGVPMWGWLADAASIAKPLDHPRVFLALGVIASTLQNVATMRAQISLSGRNAERFAMLADRFKQLAETELPSARQAAAQGDLAGVNSFTDSVMRELDAEAKAWREVRGAIRPLSKMPWRKER